MSFVINIHHIGTLESFGRFGDQLADLFGDKANPFDPKYSGNKITLVVNGELATSLQALAASGNSYFTDLGIGGALHGWHNAFNDFQTRAINTILNNPAWENSPEKNRRHFGICISFRQIFQNLAGHLLPTGAIRLSLLRITQTTFLSVNILTDL